jgi:catalase
MDLVDFEQPRALWRKVFNDVDRDHLVLNIAGHLGNCKKAEIKARQRKSINDPNPRPWFIDCPLVTVFAAVDQDLSDRIAQAIGVNPVKPLQVKSAAEAERPSLSVGVIVKQLL